MCRKKRKSCTVLQLPNKRDFQLNNILCEPSKYLPSGHYSNFDTPIPALPMHIGRLPVCYGVKVRSFVLVFKFLCFNEAVYQDTFCSNGYLQSCALSVTSLNAKTKESNLHISIMN